MTTNIQIDLRDVLKEHHIFFFLWHPVMNTVPSQGYEENNSNMSLHDERSDRSFPKKTLLNYTTGTSNMRLYYVLAYLLCAIVSFHGYVSWSSPALY
jgi:hypothetical protein